MTPTDQLAGFVESRLPGVRVLAAHPMQNVPTSSIWVLDCESVQPDGEDRPPPHQLVVRAANPGGPLAVGALEKPEEFQLLRALQATDVPVPSVRLFDQGDNPLGVPLFVMDRVPGEAEVAMLHANPDVRTRLLTELVGHMARLHTLDWSTLGLDFLRPPPPGKVATHWFEYWVDLYSSAAGESVPLLGDLGCWLVANAPADGPVVLCWGDPGPGNFIATDRAITALIDWELAHLGDPADDLGFLVWRLEQTVGAANFDQDALVAEYTARSGHHVMPDALHFYRVMAYAKTAIWAGLASVGFASGRSLRPEYASAAMMLPRLWLQRAAELAWG